MNTPGSAPEVNPADPAAGNGSAVWLPRTDTPTVDGMDGAVAFSRPGRPEPRHLVPKQPTLMRVTLSDGPTGRSVRIIVRA